MILLDLYIFIIIIIDLYNYFNYKFCFLYIIHVIQSSDCKVFFSNKRFIIINHCAGQHLIILKALKKPLLTEKVAFYVLLSEGQLNPEVGLSKSTYN